MSTESQFTEEHFAALGKINVYFQYIDKLLDYTLTVFLGAQVNDRYMHIFMSEVPFRTKLQVLSSIVHDIKDFEQLKDIVQERFFHKEQDIFEKLTELKGLISLIDKCGSVRNEYSHSHWIDGGICGPEPDNVYRVKFKAKGKKIRVVSDFETISSLNEKATFIRETSDKLLTISTFFQAVTWQETT